MRKKRAADYRIITQGHRKNIKLVGNVTVQRLFDIYNAEPAVTNIPYATRNLEFLKDTCNVRDISSVGSHPTLVARLTLHDEKKQVLTDWLETEIYEEGDSITGSGEHVPAYYPTSTYTPGREQQLLFCIPHIVIRNCIVPYLSNADLFSLLFTCTYTYSDALAVLQQRAPAYFNLPNARPLALSAMVFYERMLNRQLFKTNGYMSKAICYVISKLQRNGFTIPDRLSIKSSIAATIVKYGSMEGFVLEKDRKRQLALVKKEEKRVIVANSRRRFEECQSRYPEVLDSFSDAGKLEFTAHASSIISQGAHGDILKMLSSYIRLSLPVSIELLETKMSKYSKYLQLFTIVKNRFNFQADLENWYLPNQIYAISNIISFLSTVPEFDVEILPSIISKIETQEISSCIFTYLLMFDENMHLIGCIPKPCPAGMLMGELFRIMKIPENQQVFVLHNIGNEREISMTDTIESYLIQGYSLLCLKLPGYKF
jgi:hypothetical protein